MPVYVIALVVGLVLLVGGADLLVRGGGKLALALRIPALVVGLTIVAFGTSTPELAVSVTAAFRASTEMALANVTGSNIANIALVLGLVALVQPIKVDRGLIRREVPVCLGLQLLVPLLLLDGVLGRIDGGILLAAGVVYNVIIVWDAIANRPALGEDDPSPDGASNTGWNVFLLLLGVAVLLVGAHVFVGGAVEVAGRLGLSDRFIGLTVVALGTSAPEIATGVVSAYRGEADLALGNSLGSNVLNITLVLSATALIRPIVIVDQAAFLDLGVALATTLLLVPMVVRDRLLSRVEGGILAGGYVVYLLVSP